MNINFESVKTVLFDKDVKFSKRELIKLVNEDFFKGNEILKFLWQDRWYIIYFAPEKLEPPYDIEHENGDDFFLHTN